ncbi:DUF881 domain-containing protein [Paramaledivibacter caminithermalis]|jgi:uncharacterized protein YlxW (UPF0749 family)|uniref:Uncharacterized conserved protein YlxW, UPF0749 family n=1 Tax=Paramaledivibacter caminithermalis (strain DSM 15212 / CIP 107654 / DViRD3) TaxID=1121301 RepID=A0A1M6S1T9_PARC5|nr:DUF881 domain-containing protein [Paramaledivibacter caminithermalis]SHK38478.1 Uncharacterized conserved protein YlxW, UPF0749 family [Paramaledivibacter caminithermalis DSM 15212]
MKKKYIKLNIFVLTTILGILVSFQVKSINNNQEYVSLDEIRDYKQNLEKEKAEIAQLNTSIEDYKNKIEQFRLSKIRDGDITKLLKEEIKEYKTISGFTDVYGPGVIIIMDDATRELYEGENPNDVLVHDVDVLNIVNDLKAAGAEAISINGQRVLSNSEIDCSGYTIKINGKEYGHPFIIKAIGEPQHLEAAINAPMTYGYMLKTYGIFIEVNPSTYVKVPKYDGTY